MDIIINEKKLQEAMMKWYVDHLTLASTVELNMEVGVISPRDMVESKSQYLFDLLLEGQQ